MKIVYQNVACLLIFVGYNYLCLAQDGHENEESKRRKYFPRTIGAYSQEKNGQAKLVFDSIIYTANLKEPYDIYKTANVTVSGIDSFEASKSICDLANEGVVGIFGPVSNKIAPIIESTCLNLEIPYIQTSWRPSLSGNSYKTNESTFINLFPKTELLTKGIASVVKHLYWKSFLVLYEDFDSLVRLQDVLKIQKFDPDIGYNTLILKHLGPGPDYRPVLKEILNTTEHRIILDCKTGNIIKILEQAKELKLLEPSHNYFLTSLDAHTVNLGLLNTTANITTIRIIDYESANLKIGLRNWQQYAKHNSKDHVDLEEYSITTETALMNDAVWMFLEALRIVDTTNPIYTQSLTCSENKDRWAHGLGVTALMKQLEHIMFGVTGPIKFDSMGNRIKFKITVTERHRERNNDTILATWDPDDGNNITYFRTQAEIGKAYYEKLKRTGDKLIVSSRIGDPYLMKKKPKEGEIVDVNNPFEGFSVDLIAAICQKLNLTYEFKLAADNKYGNYDPETKSWNGLIKDILDGTAQLAICDLTITHERREVVDFSTPFMRLGIAILLKKEADKEVNMFAFLDPLSVGVWIYSATLYLSLTVVIYFVARGSPADWENPHPCEEDPEELENIWTIKNCLWLTLGSIMNQGCDILPKGVSTRTVTAMWWFFAIIITNSYMANLAAFLTKQGLESEIKDAKGLSEQTSVKYGTLKGGSTEAFFRNATYPVHQRMWTAMQQERPTVFVSTNDEGVKRVQTTRNGLYAFLMESTSIEYQLQTKCDLKKVGNPLDNKGYGIAMPLDYPLRTEINRAILELKQNGEISRMKKKWWEEKRDEPACPKETEEEGGDAKLALNNVGGVFLVLGVGLALAYVVAILEFLWNVRNVSVEEHITFWQAFKAELRFALMVWVTKKRAKPKISESSSSARGSGSGIANILHLDVLSSRSRSPSRHSRHS